MSKQYSCYGCKYLFMNGTGWSDWTWEGTEITCAKDLNNNLPIEAPDALGEDMAPTLRFMAILACECDEYSQGALVTVSPDGNVTGITKDDEQMRAILGDAFKEWKDEETDY